MSTNHYPPPIEPSSSNAQKTTMSIRHFSYPDITSHRLSSHPLTNSDSPQMNSNIQPNNPQHPSHKSHASQSIPSMSCQPASRNLSQHCDFQDSQLTITQLQSLNKNQSEQITELKIRAAVLENELSHARQDKEAVSNSLGIVIESLTRFHHSTSASISAALPQNLKEEVGLGVYMGDQGGKIKELEKEIEGIGRENRCLRRREKEFGYAPLRVGDNEKEEHHVHFQPGMPIQGSSGEKGKGKERMRDSFEHGHGPTPDQLIGSWGNPSSFQHRGNANANGLTSSQLIGSWGNPDPSFGGGEAGPQNFNNSFGSGSTTVPNTPLLNATSFESNFADVGLHSLEENMSMDNEGFPPALSFPTSSSKFNINSNSSGEQNGGDGEEEEKDIDERLLDQQAAMSKFMAMPKPNILKVGFEVEGTKRGPDYDANPHKPPSYRRNGSMRTYDRFEINAPPAGSRGTTEMKIPTDLSKDEGLWEGREERKDAVEIHMRSVSSRARDSESRFPEFFRYGIVYRPSSTDSNFLRTVMLGNLPLGTELRDVLARVRGGEVLSASLLDTRSIMGGLSARVVFRHEGAAEEYVLYAKEHPILFGEEGEEAEVTLLTTPTYPPSPRFLSRLLTHAQTRCLALPLFPPHLSLTCLERQLACNNGRRGDMLVEYFIDEEGALNLQFSDVQWAGAAYGILTNFRDYRGLDVKFVEDPCTGPLSDLALPIPPRPPMLPKNWGVLQKQYAENGYGLGIGGVGGDLLAEQRRRFAALEGKDGDIVREVEGLQRKRLAALGKQKVEIPSFSGQGITGESWADEVIGGLESEVPLSLPTLSSPTELGVAVPPNSPIQREEGDVEGGIDAILVENVNEMMFQGSSMWWKDEGLSRAPVGLSGSKYASRVPLFSDDSARSRLGSQSPNSRSSTSPLLLDNTTDDPKSGITNPATGNDNVPSREEEEDSSSDCFPTLHDIAKQRLQVLSNQASLPPLITTNLALTSFNPKPLNKTPPRVNLHDLFASSPSSSSISSNASSPPSHPHKRKSEDEPVRMPKGPRGNGFASLKGKRYDSLEAETDEVNLKMPSELLALDEMEAMSPVSEGVKNPDEISLSDDEGGEDGKQRVDDRVVRKMVTA